MRFAAVVIILLSTACGGATTADDGASAGPAPACSAASSCAIGTACAVTAPGLSISGACGCRDGSCGCMSPQRVYSCAVDSVRIDYVTPDGAASCCSP